MTATTRPQYFAAQCRRYRILDELKEAVGRNGVQAAESFTHRLLESLPHQRRLSDNCVMVPYGGGKDSSFVVAMTRLAQLQLEILFNDTFRLRCLTNFQPGMGYGVTQNISRAYERLALIADPTAELLIVDGNRVVPFDPQYTMSAELLVRTRFDVLMNGHLSRASNRATFCNSCNFAMGHAFRLGLQHGSQADIVITGDSPREQKLYFLAITKMARELGVSRGKQGGSFGAFMQTVDTIANTYHSFVFGADDSWVKTRTVIDSSQEHETRFVSLFDEMSYEAGAHWKVLTDFLGFEFHDLAFSFTESDCANPALMCHLRGLKAERLWGRQYHEGVGEYRDFAIRLMLKKDFPEHLVQIMEERYRNPAAMDQVRRRVEAYARSILGLSEEQLVCMVFSPFTENGKHLIDYITRVHPSFTSSIDAIRAVLAGAETLCCGNSHSLPELLEAWSGLSVADLRRLFRMPLADNVTPSAEHATTNPIRIMFRHDPHQDQVKTRHSPDGQTVIEIESGR